MSASPVPELELAKKEGKKRYFTGRPCKHGHTSERFTSGGACIACHHLKCNEAYHAMDPIKKAAYVKRSYERVKATPHKRLLVRARKRAKDFGLEFSITLDDIKMPEFCPVFGTKLVNNEGYANRDNSMSLDRIDSSKGYTPDNICVISNRANSIKGNATIEDLEKLIAYMKLHNKN